MKPRNAGDYWDARLTLSPGNPFPLAPKDVEVTAESYSEQNRLFGEFCGGSMIAELEDLATKGKLKHPEYPEIHILGVGLGRDRGWMMQAKKMGFNLVIWDVSHVACEYAKSNLYLPAEINQVEVMNGWETGVIDERRAVIYYACQFIEHQGDNLPEFMRHFGKFLRKPGRKVCLVLSRLEDNPPELVKWNTAIPPCDEEWQAPLKEGFGGQVNIYVSPPHKYFHRTYRFVRLGE